MEEYIVSWGGLVEAIQECEENKEELAKLQSSIDRMRKMEEIRNTTKSYTELYDILSTFTDIEVKYLNSPLLDGLKSCCKGCEKQAQKDAELYQDLICAGLTKYENDLHWTLPEIEDSFLNACFSGNYLGFKFLLPFTKVPLAGISKAIYSNNCSYKIVMELLHYVISKGTQLYYIQEVLMDTKFVYNKKAIEILELCFREKKIYDRWDSKFDNILTSENTCIEVILWILNKDIVKLWPETITDLGYRVWRENNEELKNFLITKCNVVFDPPL